VHRVHALKIEIAAGQIALDRGYQELEAQRQKAVRSGEAADAADVMEMRSALAIFRGKIANMRESLVGSATLIPIIGQNRKAAETRIMKISDGLLVAIVTGLVGAFMLGAAIFIPASFVLIGLSTLGLSDAVSYSDTEIP
jgi:hypothetical protein